MPTVTLVTSQRVLASPAMADPELELVQRALAQRGVGCELVDWRAASDLSGSELVVIKSPWDYPQRAAEFVSWLGAIETQTRVANHPETIRWNLDKRYLGQLGQHGLAVCPTEFCRTMDEVRSAVAAIGGQLVVKPTVSASSADTGLFQPDDLAALDLARHILGLGKEVMVQPALESVARVGERSLVHFDGRFVHAARRSPLLALGGGLLGTSRGRISSVLPDRDELGLAAQALAVAGDLLAVRGVDERPLHARVDIARDGRGRPVVSELELFEPSFFLELAPGAERLYVDAILARLEA